MGVVLAEALEAGVAVVVAAEGEGFAAVGAARTIPLLVMAFGDGTALARGMSALDERASVILEGKLGEGDG